jgi:hypothetical protein
MNPGITAGVLVDIRERRGHGAEHRALAPKSFLPSSRRLKKAAKASPFLKEGGFPAALFGPRRSKPGTTCKVSHRFHRISRTIRSDAETGAARARPSLWQIEYIHRQLPETLDEAGSCCPQPPTAISKQHELGALESLVRKASFIAREEADFVGWR